jgi:hypothetical protein
MRRRMPVLGFSGAGAVASSPATAPSAGASRCAKIAAPPCVSRAVLPVTSTSARVCIRHSSVAARALIESCELHLVG